jgi:hypothetical protein
MRAAILIVLLGCNDGGGAADLSVSDLSATPCADAMVPACGPGSTPLCLGDRFVCEGPGADLSMTCGLATIDADCAASCGTPDGGLGGAGGPNWPCQPDPLCSGGHWHFDCVRH